ncbi:MAG: hypothetical protein P8R04_05710 [Gammaproteobacteria bacterium]|nr:hypothetical protein [Gammaproteobacteria bacterium]
MRSYPAPGSVDVLFVTYGGGHVQMVLPVAQALQAQGLRVCVFAMTTAIAVVDGVDLPYFTYADLPMMQEPRVQAVGARLAAEMPPGGPLPLFETEAYMGINYCDMEASLGVIEAAAKWVDGGRQHFHPMATMLEVIGDLRPQLVVATNSPRTERAAIEAATTLGLPAVVMVDLFAMQEVKWLSKPTFGQKLLVLDKSVKDMMIRHGRPPADIIVTGNPAFDGIYDPDVIAAGSSMRQIRGWGQDGRQTVLWASNPEPVIHPFTGEVADPTLPSVVENYLRNLVLENPLMELVIRRHPSEHQFIAQGDRIHNSPRSENINALIHAVDLVVVLSSTVGLQAYLAGTHVVSVEGSVFTKDAPYGKLGMATPVRELDDLAPILTKILTSLTRSEEVVAPTQLTPALNRVVSEINKQLACARFAGEHCIT